MLSLSRAAARSPFAFLAAAALLCRPGAAAPGSELAAAPAAPTASAVPIESLLTNPAQLSSWMAARHPEIAAARARVEQAEAGVDQSRVIPNPTLGVGVGGILVGPSNPGSLSTTDTMNLTVGLSETIELGKRGPRSRAAGLRRDAARALQRDVLAEKLADARDAIARVIYYSERQRVLEERLKAARNVAGLAEVRLDRGDISGIDQDRLELDADSVSREFAENRAEQEAALADCSALLLATCTIPESTMSAVDAAAPFPERPSGFEDLVRERPDVRAARLASAASREDAVYYRRQAIPDPTVGVSYTRDFLTYAGNQPHTLGASVSIPLPLFDHGQHLARSAEGQAEEYGLGARAIEARALTDARSLLVRRNVLTDKLRALSESAVPRSNGVLKSSEDAYHRGQLSLTDLLLARREHASLLLDTLDTRYELFAIRNALYRALGLVGPMGASASTSR